MKHHTFKLGCLAAALAFGAGNATAADMRIDGFASLYYGQAIEDEGGSTFADKAYGD